MDKKTLRTLEYDKVLDRLAGYTAFAASGEKARALKPSADLAAVQQALQETGEARRLIETEPTTSIGGARDIRQRAAEAGRGIVLLPNDLLDVKSTLISARNIDRQLERTEASYPALRQIALRLPAPLGLVDLISKTVSERGEILDSASPALSKIRSELKVTHERLLTKMQRLLTNDSIAPHLQESLVTQRDGRYVIPIKADSKSRVKAVVHDVSSSGATVFAEPLQVVEMNNKWRELQLAEKEEERRVLANVSEEIGSHAAELEAAVDALADLDLAFARAKYAEDLHAELPEIKPFQPGKQKHPGLTMHLWQARHPLLDPDTVVPVDIALDPETYIMLITGPNTGGKTVTLKTAGLLVLMAQSGMHIPVQAGSEISLFAEVFADIGDEQSIEQSLSTFSSHITKIIKILDKAGGRSLVILDELGSGTDPQEGAALAQAILNFLVEKGVPTLVATHYPELKAYANATPGVVNASMEFDIESLRPTYRLTVGLPGRSNALAIATRLGLRAEIVEAARSQIDPTDLRAEDLLDEIHRQREVTRTAREAAEKAQRKVESLRDELASRLEAIEDERLSVLEKARQEAQAEVKNLQDEIKTARGNLANARLPLEALEEIAEKADEIAKTVKEPVERQRVAEELPVPPSKRPIRLGDRVRLHSLGQEGIVTTLGQEEAEVAIGNLRIRVDRYDISLAGEKKDAEKPIREIHGGGAFKAASPGMELSLRGMAADEALEALENYLDKAYVAGLPYVRIVHGKGTGKLRDAVRAALKNYTQVSRFEAGGTNEGGDGVTIVFLSGD